MRTPLSCSIVATTQSSYHSLFGLEFFYRCSAWLLITLYFPAHALPAVEQLTLEDLRSENEALRVENKRLRQGCETFTNSFSGGTPDIGLWGAVEAPLTMSVSISEQQFNRYKADPNRLMTGFADWTANRLNISVVEARRRVDASNGLMVGGWAGDSYDSFMADSYKLFSPFVIDSPEEVMRSYMFHAPMEFLRYLSYPVADNYAWPGLDAGIAHLIATHSGESHIRIVDYGCGLAGSSFFIAEELRLQNKVVELWLFDVPTLRRHFLAWYCARYDGVRCILKDIIHADLPPSLPQEVHLVVATEVFEHLYPSAARLVASNIVRALRAGGWLKTQLADHDSGFGHVTPKLDDVREHLLALGLREINHPFLYVKD